MPSHPTPEVRARSVGFYLLFGVVLFVGIETFSLLVFGPGEAKGEMKKRLEHAHLGKHIVAIETSDKMTDRQIAAKVREYFHK